MPLAIKCDLATNRRLSQATTFVYTMNEWTKSQDHLALANTMKDHRASYLDHLLFMEQHYRWWELWPLVAHIGRRCICDGMNAAIENQFARATWVKKPILLGQDWFLYERKYCLAKNMLYPMLCILTRFAVSEQLDHMIYGELLGYGKNFIVAPPFLFEQSKSMQ